MRTAHNFRSHFRDICAATSRLWILALLTVLAVLAANVSDNSTASADSISAISAGSRHTCAITGVGGLRCWGANWGGQLGNGVSGDAELSPVDVAGLDGPAQDIAAGGSHTCAIISGGRLQCWGANQAGQLGDGAGGEFGDLNPMPVDVEGLLGNVLSVDAGTFHTCAVTEAAQVACWGYNVYSQLGAGPSEQCQLTDPSATPRFAGAEPTPCSTVPQIVPELHDIKTVALGANHTCALNTAGTVRCWGLNNSGQLGSTVGEACTNLGRSICTTTPTKVQGLPASVIDISAGSSHTCALTDSGQVFCWGDNLYGQLGVERSLTCDVTAIACSPAPVTPTDLDSNVVAVVAGSDHTCAVTDVGTATCWGSIRAGQLGDGTGGLRGFDERSTAVGVCVGGRPEPCRSVMIEVAGLAAGSEHSCALMAAGGVWCWGGNSSGQLGDGTQCCHPGTRTTAMPVVNLGEKSPLFGDANCTNTRDSIDASHILRMVAGLLGDVRCPLGADVNQDGTIDALDAFIILQYVVRLIERLPVRS